MLRERPRKLYFVTAWGLAAQCPLAHAMPQMPILDLRRGNTNSEAK